MTKLQSHFHLDLPTNVDADNAPAATYKSSERVFKPTVSTNVITSHTGSRHLVTIVDESNNPILKSDYKFRIVISQAEYETLTGLIGRELCFIDHYHPDVGSDHESYIKNVSLVNMTDISGVGRMFVKILATIEIMEL